VVQAPTPPNISAVSINLSFEQIIDLLVDKVTIGSTAICITETLENCVLHSSTTFRLKHVVFCKASGLYVAALASEMTSQTGLTEPLFPIK
jgi:hypothetical protein